MASNNNQMIAKQVDCTMNLRLKLGSVLLSTLSSDECFFCPSSAEKVSFPRLLQLLNRSSDSNPDAGSEHLTSERPLDLC